MLVKYQMNKKILIKKWREKIKKNSHGDKYNKVDKIRRGSNAKLKMICVKTVEDVGSTKQL